MIEALEIERMSPAEKVQAMELLWRSMSAKPQKVESPLWHKKILAGRLAKVEAGKGKFLTISEVKKRLAKTGHEKVVVLADVLEDIEKARDFYDRQSPDLGDYFADSLLSDI
jgi:putative addiction module component (TIGR02574 family)